MSTVVSSDSYSINFFSYKDSKPADEGDIQMELNTPFISFDPQYSSHNKRSTCKNLGQYRHYLIIQNIW